MKGKLRRWGLLDRQGPRRFLRHVSGIIHVGANEGQERKLYDQYGLNVLWVEALDEAFHVLVENLAGFPKQRAIQCLVTDRDDGEYTFHVASNAGASSSIFDLHMHRDIWPEVTYTTKTKMKSKTLVGLLRDEGLEPSAYDALVMDTQGSELLILEGAASCLGGFKYIQTEVADFEAYKGCCQLADLESFLSCHGYAEDARKVIARHPEGGKYYEIVFRRDLGRSQR